MSKHSFELITLRIRSLFDIGTTTPAPDAENTVVKKKSQVSKNQTC